MVDFYLASSAESPKSVSRATAYIKILEGLGWECTFNWTLEEDKLIRAIIEKDDSVIGVYRELCKMGVHNAEVVIGLLPGRLGTHWELGLADAWNKPIVLVGNAERFCPFYGGDNIIHREPLPFEDKNMREVCQRLMVVAGSKIDG
jgi:hypothetical protein